MSTIVYRGTMAVSVPPASGGLRIKSLDPVGLYIASADRAAAIWWFQQLIIDLALRRGLVQCSVIECFRLAGTIDWDYLAITGRGGFAIEKLSPEEAECWQQNEPFFAEEMQELQAWCWKDWKGRDMWLVSDSHSADPWILESVAVDQQVGAFFNENGVYH